MFIHWCRYVNMMHAMQTLSVTPASRADAQSASWTTGLCCSTEPLRIKQQLSYHPPAGTGLHRSAPRMTVLSHLWNTQEDALYWSFVYRSHVQGPLLSGYLGSFRKFKIVWTLMELIHGFHLNTINPLVTAVNELVKFGFQSKRLKMTATFIMSYA